MTPAPVVTPVPSKPVPQSVPQSVPAASASSPPAPPTPAPAPGAAQRAAPPPAAPSPPSQKPAVPAAAVPPRPVAPLNPLAVSPAPPAPPVPAPAPKAAPSPAPAATPAPAAAASAALRQASAEASRAVSTAGQATARPAPTSAETASPVRFALLVMGLLAATVLLVTLVLNAGRGGGDQVEDDPAKLQLPEVVRAPGDEAFPVVLSEGSPTPDLTILDQGTVLLVFADVASEAGRETAARCAEMHRRLRAYDVRTVLVLPREVVTSDPRAEPTFLKERLSALGIRGDVPVLLDVGDDRGGGRLRRVRWQVPDPNAAIVLEGGREIMRVSPASRQAPLLRAHLALLVKKAAHLGGLRPEEGPDEEDEDAEPDEGPDDGPTALDGPPRRPSRK